MSGRIPLPHDLAGVHGEGPPVAPPLWTWRCGNRVCDMYFYSPCGGRFASRKRLAAFLSESPHRPSPNDFCWHVTREILETGVWTKNGSSANCQKMSLSNLLSIDEMLGVSSSANDEAAATGEEDLPPDEDIAVLAAAMTMTIDETDHWRIWDEMQRELYLIEPIEQLARNEEAHRKLHLIDPVELHSFTGTTDMNIPK